MTIRTSTQKHTALYKMHIQYKAPDNTVLEDKHIESSFTRWFSADGTFHPEPLREWLASEVEVLRLAAKETEKRTGGVSGLVGVEGEKDEKEGDVTKRR